MKFMDRIWGGLGLLESVDVEEEEKQKVEEIVEPKSKRNNNLVNLPTAQPKQVKVMIVEPFSFDDAQNVADHLKNRKPVVVNLENTDREVAKRIIDFISGTTYAVSGSIQKVGNNIFLCAPNNIDVAYSPRSEESTDNVLSSWNNK